MDLVPTSKTQRVALHELVMSLSCRCEAAAAGLEGVVVTTVAARVAAVVVGVVAAVAPATRAFPAAELTAVGFGLLIARWW